MEIKEETLLQIELDRKVDINESAIQFSTDLVYIVNRHLNVIFANTNFIDFAQSIAIRPPFKIGDNIVKDLLLHEIQIKEWSVYFKRAFKGESFAVEIHLNLPSLNINRWSEMIFSPIYEPTGINSISVFSREITQRKKNETQLIETNRRLKNVLLSSADWAWEVNACGEYTYCSEKVKEHLGYTPQEMIGKTPFDFMDETEAERVGTIFQQIVANKQSIKDLENWNIHKEGHAVCLLTNGYPLFDKNGNLEGFIGVDKNITNRKKIEEETIKTNNILIKKVEEVSALNLELERFAYVASHDLQEPLRMVSTFLQMFEKKYVALVDETGKKYIHYAVTGANRMKLLISDLLEYSKSSANVINIEKVSVKEVIEDILVSYTNENTNLDVEVIIDELPVINACRIGLSQLYNNLIGNAFKYRSTDKIKIHFSVEQTDEEWIFSIKDNGIGIDPKFHEKIFVLFQRLHTANQYIGTGIGLSVCKKIIEKCGGKIWVESELKKGANFKFTVLKSHQISHN